MISWSDGEADFLSDSAQGRIALADNVLPYQLNGLVWLIVQ